MIRRFITFEDGVQICIQTIREEPILVNSPFIELGFWRGLWITLWMIFHPYKNARRSVYAAFQCVIKKIEDATKPINNHDA